MKNMMTIDSWLLRGTQEPDFEMRLAIYEELRAKRKDIERLRRTIGFFVSVIKSGEPWTETCQEKYEEAL